MSKIFVVIIIVITIISHLSSKPLLPPSFSTLLSPPLLIKDSPSLGGVRDLP